MAAERLSHLQRRILAWLAAAEQRTRGTMSASHEDLVHALAHDNGNLSRSLANIEAKGLIRITQTAGGKAKAVDLTPEGRAASSSAHRKLGLIPSPWQSCQGQGQITLRGCSCKRPWRGGWLRGASDMMEEPQPNDFRQTLSRQVR